eukprot:TRINITY_DN2420_c0_g1_i1.p1 TRINITY_DN2420_c0_g1~~TRINITY_DN2420_c0_g1_i1.p1  ORF type:complete len:390 (-),score=64.45 TRINITY_DN2420_c0_g1_i1:437-1606(-)
MASCGVAFGYVVLASSIIFGFLGLSSLKPFGFSLTFASPNYVAWQPPSHSPRVGPFAPLREMGVSDIFHLFENQLVHPEAIAFDTRGGVVTGTRDGSIWRFPQSCATDNKDCTIEEITNTLGRPLGLQYHPDGYLVVADAVRGLLKVNDDSSVEILTNRDKNGRVLTFIDDVTISSQGIIYFSDACDFAPEKSDKTGDYDVLLSAIFHALEARPTGSVLEYNPKTKETRTLMTGLHFANGVALSQDESFIVVSETYKARLLKYQLTGNNAGSTSVFIDNLPGYCDNVRSAVDGGFWVAIPSPPNPILTMTGDLPAVRALISTIVEFIPMLDHYGMVIKVDNNGQPITSIHDPRGRFLPPTTHVTEHDGKLWFGTISENFVSVCLTCVAA